MVRMIAAGTAVSVCVMVQSAGAAITVMPVTQSGTSSAMRGGDRELQTLSFGGSVTQFTGANFLHWDDGSLTNNVGFHGWNQQVLRDVDGRNDHTGNPDRADNASPFAGEAGRTGTMREVFGAFSSGSITGGYKNMSYLIDGEDSKGWQMDLRLGSGLVLRPDGDASTVELAVLERGMNSDFAIAGIFADGSVTAPVVVLRGQTGYAGWMLDTLEIGGAQKVGGVGLSVDQSWDGVVGVRITAKNGYNGPDIVAVGTVTPVPTPGAVALMAMGGLIAARRRRTK